MKAIKITNIVLLIIAIICVIVFTPLSCKKEKYGDYNKFINVTEKDVYPASYNIVQLVFDIENTGDLDVREIDVSVTIKNIFNQSQEIYFDVKWTFSYGYNPNPNSGDLLKNSTKEVSARYNAEDPNKWIKNCGVNDLLFTYKIKSITFTNGTTYNYFIN